MKGYMIRYALSKGIRTVDIERVFDNGSAFVTWKGNGADVLEDDELFRTKEDAEDAARRMATERIGSLKKSIAKMEKLAEHPKWERGS